MFDSVLYTLLALLGLSFLIFIHELGHYWAAIWTGMRVETFAIGFGKPILSWKRKGVTWQLGWLFFGGYVKIAGQDVEGGKDPYAIKDGFYGKSPFERIKVAFAGPLMNLFFAFAAFALLWGIGGRVKSFSEHTQKIGWVDTRSELYAWGVRPGDEVASYDDQPVKSARDHITAPLLADGEIEVKGYKVDYRSGEKEPFTYTIKTYPHPLIPKKGFETVGVSQTASYLVYGGENPIPENSPMHGSGIKPGDRIVWADGEPVFSLMQLSEILNDDRLLVTVKRGEQTLLRRVPRVKAQELFLDGEFKEELIDWQHEASLNTRRIQNLYTIPYNLNNESVVEGRLRFIDKEVEEELMPRVLFSTLHEPLLPGDKIIAVNGEPVSYSYQLLTQIQTRRVNLIVERTGKSYPPVPADSADREFDSEYDLKAVDVIAQSIGTGRTLKQHDEFYLLKTVTPQKQGDFELSEEIQEYLAVQLERQKKMIEKLEDPERRADQLNRLENRDNLLILGLPGVQDRKVQYNPLPTALFASVFDQIRDTLSALFTGNMGIEMITGPVGIIQVVQEHSLVSLKESLFWMGVISLNLGVINLLPIPVLDGGAILFALYEIVTRKRISPKVMERMVLPFVVLLIGLILFLTYNDLSRIFSRFF